MPSNSSTSDSKGFSLMNSLGGSSSNQSTHSNSSHGGTARLREGLGNNMSSNSSNSSLYSHGSRPPSSPAAHLSAVPLQRTSHSFSSATSSTHQGRRTASYRAAPPTSPSRKQSRWNFISPNNSMDGGDREKPDNAASNGGRSVNGVLSPSSSFEDACPPHRSPSSPSNKDSSPSAAPSKTRRSFFSTKEEETANLGKPPSMPHSSHADSSLSSHLTSYYGSHRMTTPPPHGSSSSPPNTPPISNTSLSSHATSNALPSSATFGGKPKILRSISPKMMHGSNASNSTRPSGPSDDGNDAKQHSTTASRMKQWSKTWTKNKKRSQTTSDSGIAGVRSLSGGRAGMTAGGYSEAVTKVLQEDEDGGTTAHELERKGSWSGSRKSGSIPESGEMEEGLPPTSPTSPHTGKQGVMDKIKVRNRSPSPVRYLSYLKSDIMERNESGSTSGAEDDDNKFEEESNATTTSFFQSRGIRGLSPARVRKSLAKRLLSIPVSPRRDRPQSQPSQDLNVDSADAEPLSPQDQTDLPNEEEAPNRGLFFPSHTTMSFDVDDSDTVPLPMDAVEVVATELKNKSSCNDDSRDIYNQGDAGEEIIESSSTHIFQSKEFIRAMGGGKEAFHAASFVQSGDQLCNKDEPQYEKAISMYYAGLGAICVRVSHWVAAQRTGIEAGSYLSLLPGMEATSGTAPASPTLQSEDVTHIARSPEMNVLLLTMASILLRAGNAHFRLGRWGTAYRDYTSAQSYRSLRKEAMDKTKEDKSDTLRSLVVEKPDNRFTFEDAKLDGRISNNMASAQSKLEMYDEARTEYTEALRIKQSTLHALHDDSSNEGETASLISGIVDAKDISDDDIVTDIATTLHNIGLLRSKCDEPKKAEKAYKQSLSLRVKKFGLDDLGVSATLCTLGDLYFQQKRYDDAFRSYKESLRIQKLHFGKSVAKMAELYYNIGLVFHSKGPYSKAKISLVECLRLRRELSPDSLHVASALHLLALVTSSMGYHGDALEQLDECLTIRQRELGEKSPNHLLLLNVHMAIGLVYQAMGNFTKAMDSFRVALMGRTERLGKDHPSVCEVLQAIGVAYIAEDEIPKALETLEETLRLRQASLGPSMEVAETLDSLSLVFFKSGDTEKAIDLSEETLGILKTAVGFDHILVAKVLKNMGDFYQDLEAFDDATEAYDESLRVMTLWHGKEHISLSEVLNEVGVTQFKKGEYMIAKNLFMEALRIMCLDSNGAKKSTIFPTLNHLGHALYKNKELNTAADKYMESIQMQTNIVTGKDVNGFDDISEILRAIQETISSLKDDDEGLEELSDSLGGIGSTLRYLGLVYQEGGDLEMALEVNKLSLSVRLSQPYKDYSAIALMAETIAMFEFKRNNLNSALDYFNQALDAKKSFQGDSTIDVARTVNNLANIQFSLGNLDDAMRLYQDALEIKRLRLGNDSDEVANTLNNIAHVMLASGKEQEALQAYHHVVRIRQERYGKNHVSVAATLASMGDVYIKLGKLEIAMTYFEQCIRIRKLRQEKCDERMLENLASIYGKLGEWHKAEAAFKETVELKQSIYGNDCIEIAKTLDLLAVSYIEQDRYVDSIEYLKEALRIRRVCLGDDDDEILASLNKLAFVYKSCEMLDEMLAVKEEYQTIQQKKRR